VEISEGKQVDLETSNDQWELARETLKDLKRIKLHMFIKRKMVAVAKK